MNPLDHLTEEQRAELDTAWRCWQAEESRDRGYDFDRCRRLRDEYHQLVAKYQAGAA